MIGQVTNLVLAREKLLQCANRVVVRLYLKMIMADVVSAFSLLKSAVYHIFGENTGQKCMRRIMYWSRKMPANIHIRLSEVLS